MKRLPFLALVTLCCVTVTPAPNGTGVQHALDSLTLHGIDGQTSVNLAQQRGQVILLDVWATWCEPCKDALLAYQQLDTELHAQGLRVYALSVDAERNDIVNFVKANQLRLPVFHDVDGLVAQSQLQVKQMPTSFLLDRNGRLRAVHEGFGDRPIAALKQELEALLAEPAGSISSKP
jgi:cytochrome c biogenesis protein CcmG, thiol:disulfide interchange protein DsbE